MLNIIYRLGEGERTRALTQKVTPTEQKTNTSTELFVRLFKKLLMFINWMCIFRYLTVSLLFFQNQEITYFLIYLMQIEKNR